MRYRWGVFNGKYIISVPYIKSLFAENELFGRKVGVWWWYASFRRTWQ